jgi:hypothetical protein
LTTIAIKYLLIQGNFYLSQNAIVIRLLTFHLPNYGLQNNAIPPVILPIQHTVRQGR